MLQREVENRGLEKEVFELVRRIYDNQQCHQTLGFGITYLGKGMAGMKIYPDPIYSTQGGRAHGGIIAALADTAMGAAAATLGNIYRTAELKINYLLPVFEEVELLAEAQVVHPGKTLAVVEANLFNPEGKIAAKSLGTYYRVKSEHLAQTKPAMGGIAG